LPIGHCAELAVQLSPEKHPPMAPRRHNLRPIDSAAVGKIGETALINLLLASGFEVFAPVVDKGSDVLAVNPAGHLLRIQSKCRSPEMDRLWDIRVGQRTRMGPPTHFFFAHGFPPHSDYWLVPAEIVGRVWFRTPAKTMRVTLTRISRRVPVREVFQPFKQEAGFQKALEWEPGTIY
jgi:hypothetical protein